MTKKTKLSASERLDAELLEMAQARRGKPLLRDKTADKITMRILGEQSPRRCRQMKSGRFGKKPI